MRDKFVCNAFVSFGSIMFDVARKRGNGFESVSTSGVDGKRPGSK